MKQIYIIRHADKDPATGELTDAGRDRARALRQRLGRFDVVIGSNRPRVIETAELLADRSPKIDERAGFTYFSKEQNEKLANLAKIHPLAHAGALFEYAEFEPMTEMFADNFIALLCEVLEKLPTDGKALIVSQDGVMMATEHRLTCKPHVKLEKSFAPLEGYIVNEKLEIVGNV